MKTDDRDDPILSGINKLVVKGLDENKNNPIPYPCDVVNRFECSCDYEKGKTPNEKANVEDLFKLAKMAFAVEISLAVSRKDTSAVQVKK